MKLNWMELDSMDAACVPAGFFLLICYHVQLLYRIWKFPTTTVLGTNQLCRQTWITYVTKDPAKHCAVAVQALRNILMAASLLATITITLSTIVGGIITHSNNYVSVNPNSGAPITSSSQLFSMLACFLISFLCTVQTVRYSCYVNFMVCVPLSDDATLGESPNYVYQSFEKSYIFWSLGLRAFYLSFPMLMWLFGPVSMLLSCFAMIVALHFLDSITTTPKKNMAWLKDQKESRVVEP